MKGIRPWLTPLDMKMQNKFRKNEITYISLLSELCINKSTCLAKVDEDNSAIVWDYGHLSLEGSSHIVSNIIFPKLRTYITN
jgi:hypothetical protein